LKCVNSDLYRKRIIIRRWERRRRKREEIKRGIEETMKQIKLPFLYHFYACIFQKNTTTQKLISSCELESERVKG
jgi:hypothetical protein